jgi:hypothetical protein
MMDTVSIDVHVFEHDLEKITMRHFNIQSLLHGDRYRGRISLVLVIISRTFSTLKDTLTKVTS